LPQQHFQPFIEVMSFMLEQVLKFKTLIMESAMLACKCKEIFEALREFSKRNLL
jgi:hypothetical protein